MPEDSKTHNDFKCEKCDIDSREDVMAAQVCAEGDAIKHEIKVEPVTDRIDNNDEQLTNVESKSCAKSEKCGLFVSAKDVLAAHICTKTDNVNQEIKEESLTYDDIGAMFNNGEADNFYRCCNCDMTFTDEDVFADHMCSDNDTEKNLDEIYEDDLDDTLQDEDSLRDYYCDKCELSFIAEDDIAAHKCAAISYSTINNNNEDDHEKDEHENLDDSLFEDQDDKSMDKSIESETENKFKCDKCGVTFLEDFELSEHKCAVFEKRHGHFECAECGRHFRYKVPYDKHLQAHTSGVDFKKNKRKWVRWKFPQNETSGGDGEKQRNKYNLSETHDKISVSYDTDDEEKLSGRISHYECATCGRHFRYKIPYEKHLAAHEADTLFPCETCGENFRKKYQLNKHKRTHTGEKPFICEICGMNFNQKTNLQSHTRTHTGEKPYQCLTCGKLFVQKSHLNTHSRIHDTVKAYMCEVCGRTFSERASLQKHNKVHERDLAEKIKKEVEQCNSLNTALIKDSDNPLQINPSICPSTLQNLNMLNKNDSNADLQILPTQETDNTETDPDKLQYPMHKAIKTQKFEMGRLLFSLKLHEDTGESIVSIKNVERPYICEYCGDMFRRRDQLRRHRRIHTGERPYSCAECGTTFTQRSNFTSHMRIHSGEKPFKCGECGKDFIQKSHLNTHSKIHLGLKPYKCDSCGKAFLEKASLAKHNRIHTGERPYKCEVCGKAFRCSSNIAKHRARGHLAEQKKILTSNKTFTCETCGLWFNAKQALSKHKKIHAELQYFQCKVCGKEFSDESYLNIHIIKHATSMNSFSCETANEVLTDAINNFTQSQPVSNMEMSTVETTETKANHNSCIEYGGSTGGSTFPPRYPPFYYPQVPGYPYKPYSYE